MENEEKMKLRRLKTRRGYNENRQVAKEKNLTKTKDVSYISEYINIHTNTIRKIRNRMIYKHILLSKFFEEKKMSRRRENCLDKKNQKKMTKQESIF